MKHYLFYSDAGHGWLEVTFEELIDLKILNSISGYSYIKGNGTFAKVYLEEDCDVGVFDKAMKKRNIEYACHHIDHGNNSPIRTYQAFPEIFALETENEM